MPNLKQLLKEKLTKKELPPPVKSFDVLGSIAIIEIPKELVKKQELIAQALLKTHKNIRSVYKKSGIHKGIYRKQELKYLAGEKNKIADYTESGVKLSLDIEKCYFSPRLSNERLRIAKLVRAKEKVLVMFSGVAPYPLIIGKNSKAQKIVGIEINPTAYKFAVENVKKNKMQNKIELLKGDVKKKIARLNMKFDRIIMPLPKNAEKFLRQAFKLSKKGTTIHYYTFSRKDKLNISKEKLKEECSKLKKKCRILKVVKCGKHSPWVFRICIDFKLT